MRRLLGSNRRIRVDLMPERLEERIVLDGAVDWDDSADASGVWHGVDTDGLGYYWYSPDGAEDGVNDYYFRYDSDSGQWERDSDTLVSVDWNDDTWVLFGDPDADSAFVYDSRWHDMGDGYWYAYNLEGAGYGYWWYMNNGTEYYCAYGYDAGDWWWDENGYYVGGGWNLFIDADGSDDFIYDGHQHDMGDGSLYTFFGSYGEWELTANNQFAYEYTPDQWWWHDGSQWYEFGAEGADPDPIFDGAWHTLDVGLQYQYAGASHVWDADAVGGFAYDLATGTWLVDTNDDLLNPLWETFDTQVATAEFLFDGTWHQVTDNHWLRIQDTQYAYWWSGFGQADTYYYYDMTVDQWWRDVDGYYGSGDVWETFGDAGASGQFVYDGAWYETDTDKWFMLDETIYGYWWYDTGTDIYYFSYDYSLKEWWQDADGDMATDDWVLYDASGTSSVPPFDLPNDSPVNIVPGAQTTDEDTPLIFSTGEGNPISVSDPDAGVYPLEVTLTVEHGTLSLSGLTGLTITSGSDDSASMTVEGSADYINAALNGLEYNPDADYFGTDTLTVITNDLGYIGTGGPLSDTDTVAVTINQLLDDVTMYEIWEGVDGSSPSYLTSFDGDLYFAASDGNDTGDSDNHGNELWRFDPDTGTLEMVADINTSWGVGSNPSYLTVFDGDLYFAANDGHNGNELWRYDPGTGAQRMTDISELGQSSDPAYLTVLNGVLYFSADNSDANGRTLGTELWQYVPGSGASLAANINTTANTGSFPSHLAAFNGAVYFSADDGTGTGYELWKYVPGSGASLVANINTTPPPDPPDPSVETGSNPMYLTVYDGALYFSADDGANGHELWTCSAADVVSMVDDINPGAADSSPRYLTVFSGYLYFSADNGTDGTELLRYDTSDGVRLASDIRSGAASSSPSYLIGFDGNLYFSANGGTDGAELWRYDPVTETAEIELDINTGSGAGSYPSYLTAVSGELFFSADDGTNGRELWRLW